MAIALLAFCHTAHVGARASTHVVQPGQKLVSIAKRYGLSLDELCSANGLRKSATIRPGQRLNIPVPGSEPEPSNGRSSDKDETIGAAHDRSNTSSVVPTSMFTSTNAAAARYEGLPKRRGLVRVIGYHGDWQGQLVDHKNRLVSKSADAISRILAWPHKDFRMNERLLLMMAQVSDHFAGRPLRVVSGYRTTSWVEESKHPLGRACDFVVLGVPNKVVRDYLKTLDGVGVGYYPNSTFVHLDVRDRNTYWVDYAGPGEPPRLTPTAVIPKDPTATADLQTDANNLEDKTEVVQADSVAQERRSELPDAHARAGLKGAVSEH